MKRKLNTKVIVLMGLFIALQIVASRFLSIEFQDKKYGFAFLVNALTGALFGPVLSVPIGVIADITGNFLFGKFGYFPGFTLNAIIEAFIYGYFLHRENLKIKDIIIASVLSTLIVSVLLTTLWVSMMTGNPFKIALITRIPSMVINFLLKIVLLPVVLPTLVRTCRRELKNMGTEL